MSDPTEKLNKITKRLLEVEARHLFYAKEIAALKQEIALLRGQTTIENETRKVVEEKKEPALITPVPEIAGAEKKVQEAPSAVPFPKKAAPVKSAEKSDIEKFIGENLYNKIGIIVLIIGIAIGGKYTIENDLISPLMRILLGYVLGAGLLVIGWRLKSKYENYSAVLVSGSMAVFYCMTYFAFDYYHLIQNVLAFIILLLITASTVYLSFKYDKAVIANIGLVGAYGIPFLVGSNNGKISLFLTYMLVINCGILVVALKKYWKSLYHLSFYTTWGILLILRFFNYAPAHFSVLITFLAAFFLLFHAMFLVIDSGKKEQQSASGLIPLFANSLVYYLLTYSLINEYSSPTVYYDGIFSLLFSCFHLITGVVSPKLTTNVNIGRVSFGLAITFAVLATAQFFEGNVRIFMWIMEAAVFFYLSVKNNEQYIRVFSFILVFISLIALLIQWSEYSDMVNNFSAIYKPFINKYFALNVLYLLPVLFMLLLNRKQGKNEDYLTGVLLSVLFLFVLFETFWIEIAHSLKALTLNLAGEETNSSVLWNTIYLAKKTLWFLTYTALFLALLSAGVFRVVKKEAWVKVVLTINFLFLIALLTFGLYAMGTIREYNLQESNELEFVKKGSGYLVLRYCLLSLTAAVFFLSYRFIQKFFEAKFPWIKSYEVIVSVALVWILSSEMIQWLDISQAKSNYKLGLSIFWGIAALILAGTGIWKRKMHFRILSFILFGITLIKLFFYDISNLNTISKTVIFILLGLLLLLVSYLYNKFNTRIKEGDN